MPSPANTAAGHANAPGATIQPIRPTNNALTATSKAGRLSRRRPMKPDTSRPAAISAAVTPPSNWPAANGVQPSAV
ncbi:hypothetical protein D3C72_1977190 [compost metagenome]